ncbi:hypothetical protein [Streptomyces antimycoticus]|uniref:hypothetical protein n=1 Tax=Streptomyces antimycoticus TaxID=68175 RepID=UPI003406E9A7
MTGLPPQDPAGHATREPSDSWPPAYWAFHDMYHRPYLEYAHVQFGDEEAAHDLVDGVFVYIGTMWRQVSRRENVGSYAWKLLKNWVASDLMLQGRDPAAAETLAFERAIAADRPHPGRLPRPVPSAIRLRGADYGT